MKRKMLKAIGYTLLIIAVLFAGMLTYVKIALPAIPVEKIQVDITPERVARGNYLFNAVSGCADCHSRRDDKLFAMPVVKGTEGGGGETFDQKAGFPGSYTAKNITPYHLGDWTDGEIFRAITSGVSKNGHALFPIMPYEHFRQADKEDIFSIIAYLRTLKPIEKEMPVSYSDFPMSFIINTIPAKTDFKTKPAMSDTVNYGKYMVNMASCITCHSQFEKGKIVQGMEFAGGRQLALPGGGFVYSANITPDMETGIGSWSRDAFVQHFRSYADSSLHPAAVSKGAFNTLMPWYNFGQMTPDDLSAIYAYLRTLPPVKNKVNKFPSTR